MGRHSAGPEHQNRSCAVLWQDLLLDVSGLFEDTYLAMGRFRRESDYANKEIIWWWEKDA